MNLRNPRKFSWLTAISVGLGVMLAAFTSISFEFGNGSFLAGVPSALGYLTIFGIALVILASAAGGIACVAGRLVGTTITLAVAFCLLFASIVSSYVGSKPMSRFRKLVWESAPKSLQITEHRMLKSFSDGTTYTFIIAEEPRIIGELCRAASLSRASQKSVNAILLRSAFPEIAFEAGTEFYHGGQIELAYEPTGKNAYLVRSPSIGRQAHSTK